MERSSCTIVQADATLDLIRLVAGYAADGQTTGCQMIDNVTGAFGRHGFLLTFKNGEGHLIVKTWKSTDHFTCIKWLGLL